MNCDFEIAKTAFEGYLDEYDREDDKIKLKIIHTYGVVDCAVEIAHRMGLSEEDTQLAAIIALLHDIGRFEQIRQFDSFQPDTMNHAEYGAELLFGERNGIRQFLKTDQYDEIIDMAIRKHSDFQLDEIEDERILLHARLIRDADKLDNCRVKLEEKMETMLGVSEEQAGAGRISPKVWESCLKKESVRSEERETYVDYWVSYIAQYYDINFWQTYEIMLEKDYIRRIVERLQYEMSDTKERMKQLLQQVTEHMQQKARGME